ncbi:MAG: C69 family dipeptidase [Bacteroidetes bacterium]|nr:C69 family dipeptidase [Bacteroidota bacterium]
MRKSLFILFLLLAGFTYHSMACTNFLFTKGSTTDGSVMITYSADSHTLYGELYHWPARDWPAGSMLDVTEWDTGKPLGKIAQVKHTYNVIGNMNEYQVAIGETTYGGREELQTQKGAIVDYGSLIYIALQRSKTAREAIKVFGELTEKYGYASEGESFSISDANEVWILEMIGKGEGQVGAVWVALRIPDGYVCGHANQARITTFPLNDPENCIYAKDVISFARSKGYFDGKDAEFSFSDTYAPVSFSGARACEARVWSMFNRLNSSMGQYQDYAMGHLTKGTWGYTTNRMPLWVKPDKKISVHDVMNLMRDHYEGTKMDMTKDIGAGPFECPYRWRPMTLKVDSIAYVQERATSTQQTGFVFVAQSRSWVPAPLGGIFWFGVDDTYTMVFSPMYSGMTKVPEAYKVGNGDMLHYSPTSAFWTFSMVSNWAYTKYNYMIKDIQPVQQELEQKYIAETAGIDKKAAELYKKDKAAAVKYITDYSVKTGQATVKRWQEMYQYLLVKYIDGNIKKEKDGKFETNPYNMPVMPSQPGYPEWWLKEIVRQHGDVLKQIGPAGH